MLEFKNICFNVAHIQRIHLNLAFITLKDPNGITSKAVNKKQKILF